VVGFYETANAVFDERTVFVRRDELAELIGVAGGQVHEIALLLADDEALDATARSLRRRFPGLTVRTWRQIQPSLSVIDSMLDTTNQLFILIILLALAFGIVNTMLMAILEQRRELGMLMAIGMSKARLFGMIVLETVLLAVTGGALGIAAGAAVIALTFRTGIDLSRFATGLAEIGYDPIVRPYIDPLFFAQLSMLIVATGIVSAIYPALKALSLHPSEALRTE
jgi:ABC-type lipoprotein release transport system permease subunit